MTDEFKRGMSSLDRPNSSQSPPFSLHKLSRPMSTRKGKTTASVQKKKAASLSGSHTRRPNPNVLAAGTVAHQQESSDATLQSGSSDSVDAGHLAKRPRTTDPKDGPDEGCIEEISVPKVKYEYSYYCVGLGQTADLFCRKTVEEMFCSHDRWVARAFSPFLQLTSLVEVVSSLRILEKGPRAVDPNRYKKAKDFLGAL